MQLLADDILWILGGMLLFLPSAICKWKGIDLGHPPYGELHNIEDIIIMQRLEKAREKKQEASSCTCGHGKAEQTSI